MDILFEQSFKKDLKKIKNKKLLDQINSLIQETIGASNILEINGIKKLKGYDSYYRIRMGNYRIGVDLTGNALIFVRILHRKDIYKFFP